MPWSNGLSLVEYLWLFMGNTDSINDLLKYKYVVVCWKLRTTALLKLDMFWILHNKNKSWLYNCVHVRVCI